MRLLLDTHTLFWALKGGERLSRRAVAAIADPTAVMLVSAASAYELCFKHRLGKLPEAAALAADFEGQLASLSAEWLPITPAHAIAAGKLEPFHRDPFDRLLIAQAMVEQVPLVSADRVFDGFGVERIW